MAIDDPQDQAEALDDDGLPAEYPPDEPYGVDDYGTTGGEQAFPEPLDEWVEREVPDPVVEADAAIAAGTGLDHMPRAEQVDDQLNDGDPTFGDQTLRDVATEREAPVAAEVDAVHIEADRY